MYFNFSNVLKGFRAVECRRGEPYMTVNRKTVNQS